MFKTTFKTVFNTVFETMFKNRVQNHVQNRVQNRVQPNKNTANKNMSFLKITDLKKRDFIVNELLKTNMQQNFLSECVGDLNTQYELSKLFKPVTEKQKI